MITINNRRAEKKIKTLVETTYAKIKVRPGKCRWNYKCHINSMHEAVRKKDKKIALVIQVAKGGCIVHFINYHNKAFIDNTLGEWSRTYDFYFVRWVRKDEFFELDNILVQYQNKFYNELGWWLKLTSKIGF